jgi:tRNA A37 threonylcarbamoyladenosine synthetase subunit TsaC/SUA5/YrdC
MNTREATSPNRLRTDAAEVLRYIHDGGVAIVPLDVAYAVVGYKEPAIRSIFKAKNRSYEKPSGMLSNWQMSDEIHNLENEKRQMIRTVIEEENLTFSVVAPFDARHPFFSDVDDFVMKNSTKIGTLDMLLNAGTLHNEIARQSWEAQKPVFGSSANTSLQGSKYNLQDVEDNVRNAAGLQVDYGTSQYANEYGRSSTIINFSDFSVIRVGVLFDRLQKVFNERFGVKLEVLA